MRGDEEILHRAIVVLLQYRALPGTIYFHAANGIPSNPRTIKRFKLLAFKPGVPDLCIIAPGGTAHFLEIKTASGRQSIDQKAFELHCEINGAPYRIARSVDEAEAILEEWGVLKQRPALRAA